MKLQIGSSNVKGQYRDSEWINIDIVNYDGVDIVGSGFELPFVENAFDEIHCIHVLEHVTRDKYPVMLREMYLVLEVGGYCYVETPDFRGTVKNLMTAFQSNDMQAVHIWTTSVYGKNERSGMAHHMGFYEELLCKEMQQVGFKEVVRCTEMISGHHKQEPVLLVRGTK